MEIEPPPVPSNNPNRHIDAFGYTTLRTIQRKNPSYSDEEIANARQKARTFRGRRDYRIHADRLDAWAVLHVLTSDSAWGSGRSHKVDVLLTRDVKSFVKDLLKAVEPNTLLQFDPSVAHFMVIYKDSMYDPSYLWMLRAYIYGFMSSINITTDLDSTVYAGTTALQMAANCVHIPVYILKTVLESGALVDMENDFGETALTLCVAHISTESTCKLLELLDYGADIAHYNVYMQTALHVTVSNGNVRALEILLDVRKERIRRSSGERRYITSWDMRLRANYALDPDPLHLPDQCHQTPIMRLSDSGGMSAYLREEIFELLVSAGAVGDENLHHKKRLAVARKQGNGEAPPFWGVINCQFLGDFVMFIIMHKELCSVEVTVSIDMLLLCVDHTESVLPPGHMSNFDIRMVFIRCMKQRFDFDAGVDGIDFDVHFDVCDSSGLSASIVGVHEGGSYKLAVRFPKGPCPTSLWTETLAFPPSFTWDITMDKQYTLAHYAAMIECKELRRRMVYLARPLCNPLLRCANGLTAADTLEKQLVGKTMCWDVKRLLAKMRRDERQMLSYVHHGALMLLVGGRTVANTTNRRVTTKSPFHDLSDDICRTILSFL